MGHLHVYLRAMICLPTEQSVPSDAMKKEVAVAMQEVEDIVRNFPEPTDVMFLASIMDIRDLMQRIAPIFAGNNDPKQRELLRRIVKILESASQSSFQKISDDIRTHLKIAMGTNMFELLVA